ncbi:hypothetical protein LTR49_021754 [Elasticomyces elasticus]|nr:hypothetical protein LTR49_021754 [Elasticomyces elasticus]
MNSKANTSYYHRSDPDGSISIRTGQACRKPPQTSQQRFPPLLQPNQPIAVLETTNLSTSTPWEKIKDLDRLSSGGAGIKDLVKKARSLRNWMESFKQKNQIPSDLCEDAETVSGVVSTSHTRSLDGISPISLQDFETLYLRDLRDGNTFNGLKNEELDSSLSFASRYTPLHSQSATSLNNEITDTPSYTCELGTVLEPFLRALPLTVRPYPPAPTSSNRHRPRSQSVPQIDQYMGGTCSSEALTSVFTAAKALDTSSEEGSNAIQGMANSIRATFQTMRPPSSRAHTLLNRGYILAVVALIEQQPEGFLDYEESVAFKKIMEKVKRQSRADSIN